MFLYNFVIFFYYIYTDSGFSPFFLVISSLLCYCLHRLPFNRSFCLQIENECNYHEWIFILILDYKSK